jgi:hypothetical protein
MNNNRDLFTGNLTVEAAEAQAEQVKKLLAKIMVSVFDKLLKKQVPIEVDAKIGEKRDIASLTKGIPQGIPPAVALVTTCRSVQFCRPQSERRLM